MRISILVLQFRVKALYVQWARVQARTTKSLTKTGKKPHGPRQANCKGLVVKKKIMEVRCSTKQ